MKKFVIRLGRDEKGVTLVEYAIALAVAIGIGTAAMSTLTTNSKDKITDAATAVGP
jgi:pilus assembly protein Flp/PilA